MKAISNFCRNLRLVPYCRSWGSAWRRLCWLWENRNRLRPKSAQEWAAQYFQWAMNLPYLQDLEP